MRFTIRDLFLVTMIVAILTAWWLDHWRQAASVTKWRQQAIFYRVVMSPDPPNNLLFAPNPPKP